MGGFDEAKENVEAVYCHFKIQIKRKSTEGSRYFWGGFRLMFGDFLSWPRFVLQLENNLSNDGILILILISCKKMNITGE